MTKFYKNNGCVSFKAKAGQNEFGFETERLKVRSVAKRMSAFELSFALKETACFSGFPPLREGQ